MAAGEYTMSEVMKRLATTGEKLSKSTLVRWEKDGVFPRPKRRARTKARIYTDEHIRKIEEYRDLTEDPPNGAPTKKKK